MNSLPYPGFPVQSFRWLCTAVRFSRGLSGDYCPGPDTGPFCPAPEGLLPAPGALVPDPELLPGAAPAPDDVLPPGTALVPVPV